MARTRGKSIDYNAAFIFYCTPDEEGRLPGYREVARHFSVARQTIERMGVKHKWAERRQKMGKEQIEKAQKTVLEQIEEANKRHLDNYIEMEKLAMKDLKDQGNVFDGKGSKIKKRKYSPWALSETSTVAKRAMNGQRIVLGLPTEVSKADVTSTQRTMTLPPDQVEEMDNYLKNNANKHPKLDK